MFEEEERDLVRRALRLDDRPVRALMTPRPRVVWLDTNDPPEETRRRAAQSRNSYYPVARGDLDELLGIASVKDARARHVTGQPADLVGALRPPALVPEGAPATDALEAFERLGLSALPREEQAGYQTVGGMMMDALGRVLRAGDRFEWEGVLLRGRGHGRPPRRQGAGLPGDFREHAYLGLWGNRIRG